MCIVHRALCTTLRGYPAPILLAPLHRHRHTQAAADAERGEAAARGAAVHFVEQGHEDARARAADRVAQRYRTAVDVQAIAIEREVGEHGEHLRGESFV